jgi:hypothetical protein
MRTATGRLMQMVWGDCDNPTGDKLGAAHTNRVHDNDLTDDGEEHRVKQRGGEEKQIHRGVAGTSPMMLVRKHRLGHLSP